MKQAAKFDRSYCDRSHFFKWPIRRLEPTNTEIRAYRTKPEQPKQLELLPPPASYENSVLVMSSLVATGESNLFLQARLTEYSQKGTKKALLHLIYYRQSLRLQACDIEGSNQFSSNLTHYSVQTIGYPACIMTIHYNFMAHVPAMPENISTVPSLQELQTSLDTCRSCENESKLAKDFNLSGQSPCHFYLNRSVNRTCLENS